MKSSKIKISIGILIFVILIIGILPKINIESGQEYLDGTVVGIVDNKLQVQIDIAYDEVIAQVGEIIEINTVEVIRDCDVSSFIIGESVRVVYEEVENNKLKNVYAIYLSSEL
ncbi:MAG: hypothetical protein R3Y40_04760 [Eubacteriales bacterium]